MIIRRGSPSLYRLYGDVWCKGNLTIQGILVAVGLGENLLAINNITLGKRVTKRVDRIGDYQLLWLL